MVACWLMQDGWQLYSPMVDHGHKTDLLISDGPNFHRIQIKTFESKGKNQEINNCWSPCKIDYVVLIARNANWGLITPAFTEKRRRINHKEHCKFEKNKQEFLRAFRQV
ncbi:hypothetical protein RBSWK_02888 [Rhodopirellula baltica SWK14]|uniref:PD(D/E)XK endonuclease domain-containing protein n=1 Tax=Rhodopirellula baltica SWK14 TaxID=993516 RepID=L7CHF6_RHOBT|nr:hypothetical protein RBSWK_02888 [Rhodopirellula baltica SWK14]